MIVSKFGGSASAHQKSIQNIKTLSKNTDRKVLIFSAIGKCPNIGKDSKVTDLLFGCVKYVKNASKMQFLLKIIINKFKNLCAQLNVKLNVSKTIYNYHKKFLQNKDANWFVSRGEYLTSYIYSKALNIKLVAADKVIIFNKEGVDYYTTKRKINYYLNKYQQIIVPGFYGKNHNGTIKLFARGGSDITGAIIATVTSANMYENWTDVDGVKPINPEVCITDTIQHLSYQDLSVMTKYDAKVIHHECVEILQDTSIVLKVANIFNLDAEFSLVDNSVEYNKFLSYKVDGKNIEIATRIKQGNLQTYVLPLNNLKQQLLDEFNKL